MAAPRSWSFNAAAATANSVGQWGPLAPWPLVAIHSISLDTGDVLAIDGWETPTAAAQIYHPANNTFTTAPVNSGVFCSAHVTLPDGRVMVIGGFAGADIGIKDANIFDPNTQTWTRVPDMHFARWYPSATVLPDGRVLVVSGNIDPTHYADHPEVYDPATNSWTVLSGIDTGMIRSREYPLSSAMPDGRVFVIAPETGEGLIIDVDAQTITSIGFSPVIFGSATMYRPGKVLYTGGGVGLETNNPSSASASVIDLTQPNPAWRSIAPMNFGRVFHSFVDLPDGNVLVVGGGANMNSDQDGTGVLPAEEWDPSTEAWAVLSGSDPTVKRLYHSSAVLMPDGQVLLAGGGHEIVTGPVGYGELSAQYFAPPYLFKGARPTIASAPPTSSYGSTVAVQTPDAANISSVALLGLSAATHTQNYDPGYVPLNFTKGSGSLSVQMPPSAGYAPPGEYRLTIVNANGAVSVGRIIRISGAPGVPPGVSATPAGDGAATVSWGVPGTGGSPISQYTVTPYIGPGLRKPRRRLMQPRRRRHSPGWRTVRRTRSRSRRGTRSVPVADSTQSSPVTPTASPAQPGVPTNVAVTLGSLGPVVTWTAPPSPGATISSYTVTPFRGSVALSPTTVSGSPPANERARLRSV